MINIKPTDISIKSLPSVTLNLRQSIPPIPAVYFCMSDAELLYIGLTVNLKRRWASHHKFDELSQENNVLIYWLSLPDEELTLKLERSFIKHYHPKFNNYQKSLDNLKLGAPARYKGKVRLSVTLLPETIEYLKRNPNMSGQVDEIVRVFHKYEHNPQLAIDYFNQNIPENTNP